MSFPPLFCPCTLVCFPAALLSTPHEKVNFFLDPELSENFGLLQRGTEWKHAHGIHFSLAMQGGECKDLKKNVALNIAVEMFIYMSKALTARYLLFCRLVRCVYCYSSWTVRGSLSKAIEHRKHATIVSLPNVCLECFSCLRSFIIQEVGMTYPESLQSARDALSLVAPDRIYSYRQI